MTFVDILRYFVGPLVAALVASGLTYVITISGKRYDMLYKERIPAFKSMISYLLRVKRYCEVRLGESSGGDFSPTTEFLVEDDKIGPLMFMHWLRNLSDEQSIFLSHYSEKLINDVVNQISLLASFELMFVDRNDIVVDGEKTIDYYENLSISHR